MKSYKLYVMNEEQSRQAQEQAFRLGYHWAKANGTVLNTEFNLLDFWEDGDITYDTDLEDWKDSDKEEISFHDFMQLKPVEETEWIDCGDSVTLHMFKDTMTFKVDSDFMIKATSCKTMEIKFRFTY